MAPRTLTRSAFLIFALVATALIWLVLLQVTSFNVITVSLGLLIALAFID